MEVGPADYWIGLYEWLGERCDLVEDYRYPKALRLASYEIYQRSHGLLTILGH